MPEISTNAKYKDRLFCLLFGKDKANALSLYNAVNGSNYADPEDIIINTIDDVIYMGMKNDVSFMLGDFVNLYEHQSTFNPNMPLRCLLYIGKLFEKLYAHEQSIYAPKSMRIATPKFVVFYNGDKYHEPIEMLTLTDMMAHPEESDIEVTVKMININYSEDNDVLNACQTLKEYSYFVQTVRDNLVFGFGIEKAIDDAVTHCIGEGVLSSFLSKHRSEVIDVMIDEYNKEEEMKKLGDVMYADGFAEGKAEGIAEGIAEGRAEGIAECAIASIRKVMSRFTDSELIDLGFAEEDVAKARAE